MTEPETISADEYNATYAGKQPKPNKYRNIKTTVDGFTFDSKKEAHRYTQLLWLKNIGAIGNLTLQPRFPLVVEGEKICSYVADFAYDDVEGITHVEDVKSPATRTPVYKLKIKLMHAIHGIVVEEV